MEKIVYFVRHGQSVGNAAAVFQHPDSPLNETGKRQAACVAGRISKLAVQALLSSPFQRAQDTVATIAQATGLTPEYCALFVERMKPSCIDGKPFADEEAHAIWTEWSRSLHTPGMRVKDGENFDDLIARADAAFAYLTARDEASIAVVTHGYFLRTMVARAVLGDMLSGEVFKRFQRVAGMENAAITAMRYQETSGEPAWRVLIYNDYAHLSECA
jgi:probable phosphoglycerate mutase